MRRGAPSTVPPWTRDLAPGLGVALLHAFNTRNLAHWLKHLATDVLISYPGLRGERGPAAARTYNANLLVAFSDLQFRQISSVTDRARITTTWRFTGTHDGDLVTANGFIPPTARTAHIEGTTVVTVHDGRIAKEETYWDRLELMTQLAAV